MSIWDQLIFFAMVFAPAIAFGIAGVVFSKREHSWQFWLLLLSVLVAAHWSIMLTDRLV